MIKVHKKVSYSLSALAFGLFIGALATIPFGARALDNTETKTESELKVTSKETTNDSQETSAQSKTTVEAVSTANPKPATSVAAPTATTVAEIAEPNEAEASVSTSVDTLQAAIAIASTEHTGSAVVSAKVKTLGAETVYKVTFADGVRVYVSADTGEILIIADAKGHKHHVQERAKAAWLRAHDTWRPWAREFVTWSKDWVKSKRMDVKNITESLSASATAEATAKASTAAAQATAGLRAGTSLNR